MIYMRLSAKGSMVHVAKIHGTCSEGSMGHVARAPWDMSLGLHGTCC